MQLMLDRRLSGAPSYRLVSDPRVPMQIPENIRGCVGFIWYRSKKHGGAARLAGTGFFVRMSSGEFSEAAFVYFVTAKHVIVGARSDSDDDAVYIKLSLRVGWSNSVQCELFSEWIFHPDDPFTDVAVIPWAPYTDPFEYRYVPQNMFATADFIKREHLDAGDDIFITGLFINHVGKHRIVPVIRVGNIAAMPEEPVQTKIGPMDAYLIEARSIGGLSGSPVFVYLSDTRRIPVQGGEPNNETWRGSWALAFLGFVQGHWDLPAPAADAVAEDSFQNERINMGVAIVVPASKIDETLAHPTLTEMREKALRSYREAHLPTMDSAVGVHRTRSI